MLIGSDMSNYTPKVSKEFPGWYKIPGYAGFYANDKGMIKNGKTGLETKGGRAGRYLKVSVFNTGSATRSLRYVHDLVCRAFHGLPKKGQVVLHKDDNRDNNKPGNLSWGSQSDNVKSAWANGLRK